jgi:hypothetical protein
VTGDYHWNGAVAHVDAATEFERWDIAPQGRQVLAGFVESLTVRAT